MVQGEITYASKGIGHTLIPAIMTMSDTVATSAHTLAENVRNNVHRIIVGNDQSIDHVLVALLSRGHVLIEDVPGTGKTTLAKALAASLRCDFGRIQFTPDLVPTDVIGVNLYDTKRAGFSFMPGPVFCQVLLADEINRATPRTQSALLEAMQEGQVSLDGATLRLPDPFFVLATLNPVEMEGTFPLPEAQLDRFMLRISLGYPQRENEAEMLARFRGKPDGVALEPVAGPEEIATARAEVDTVRVEPPIRDYLLDLVEKTRQHEHLRLGASPRASLALQQATQAQAFLQGRDFVLPDDVKSLAVPVLAHRLVTDTSARLRGVTGESVIAEILDTVPVPIET